MPTQIQSSGEGSDGCTEMPALNWDSFRGLPGGAERNFELLCRGIVRLNFGGLGVFRALANQPGVEFHLGIDKPSPLLGGVGRWWGWQCKWYDLPPNGALGATRRREIAEGIQRTEVHLPGLTDWVLWTRRALTKADQEWLSGLSTRMNLHLWTGDEIDNFLTGQAVVLRATYFGELVLTPDELCERHEQATASIRARWQPDVHHVGFAEQELRRMLGESESWGVLRTLSSELRATAHSVEKSPRVIPVLASLVTSVVETSKHSAKALNNVADSIQTGDIDLVRDELNARPRALPAETLTAPRRLRAGRELAGLYATNAVAGCNAAMQVLEDVEAGLSSRIVAVLAPAGCGKTHLSAEITSRTTTRPHGVLLHGRDLHAASTLDDLARRFAIATRPVQSMQALLAAVDAAGQRAHHRLPIVIDGLNEAEDPRTWKPLLAELEATLAKYPYVLVVCTLRPEFVDDALPDGTRVLEVKGYGDEVVDEVLMRHFQYWRIDATDASLPGFLRHPLTLRIFCEVTNPTRQQIVGVHSMPGSLTELFDRYLLQVGDRIVELAHRAHRYYAQDISAAISTIASTMWESRARGVEFDVLRRLLGDQHRPWDQSLVRALEQEGVLLRMPANGGDVFAPVYDMLGGHIIASALLQRYGQSSFDEFLKEAPTLDFLAGPYNVRHPLAEDIVLSLVGQVPKRIPQRQLWQMVDGPLREGALRFAARLDPASFDLRTVDALLGLACDGDAEVLENLWEVRGVAGHPLNADALDHSLRQMSVAHRDLGWSEWLRRNQQDPLNRDRSVLRDLERLEQRWKAGQMRADDRLRARWVMWTLTSTVRRLRDQATRSLYWFGRGNPDALFMLTIDSLSINDAYVGERMLAASYGVVMSRQIDAPEFTPVLCAFLEQLASTLVGPSAGSPTHHYLARIYVRGITAFASTFFPSCLPPAFLGSWSFAAPTTTQFIARDDPRRDEVARTMGMDFENYTLGRLFDDRRNYDMDHAGHQAAVAYVLGVVWSLGWRKASFDEVESRVAERGDYGGRASRPRAERYGKKYCWIGFYAYAGILEDRGSGTYRRGEFVDVDIDPSFPEHAPTDGAGTLADSWLSPSMPHHERWVCEGYATLQRSLLRRETILGHRGPWLAAHGYVKVADRVLGRERWARISALVTNREQVVQLSSALRNGIRPWVVTDVPSDHYIFAGEIPWHPDFASSTLQESAYFETVRGASDSLRVEVLAHGYSWENHHSEMNRAGGVLVPSRLFSSHFNLRGAAQTFDQFLPDGTRATISLSGVDGLYGDVLYIREDLVRQYLGDRAIIWFAFGERELRPYPPTPPQWLVNAERGQGNAWSDVFGESDLAGDH